MMEPEPATAIVPEGCNLRFNQKLASWFASRAVAWSGTASELMAALKPDGADEAGPASPSACYIYFESHREELRSLGIDVSLRPVRPRMITLSPWRTEERVSLVAAHPSRLSFSPDLALTPPFENHQKTVQHVSSPPATDRAWQQSSTTKSDLDEIRVDRKYSNAVSSHGHVFQNTGEALVAFGEMRVIIREQALDFRSAMQLVVERTKEMTQSRGVAIGVLNLEKLIYVAQTGIADPIAGLHFQTEVIQSPIEAGEPLQVRDAQNHFLLGPDCRQRGIGSLVVMPMMHYAKCIGILELLFSETRSFSLEDMMDIELIAGVVSEGMRLGALAKRMWPGGECPAGQ